MKSQSVVVALASLLFVACAGPEGGGEGQDLSTVEQKSLVGEPVVATWELGGWKESINSMGDGFIAQRGAGFDCWSVGMKCFRSLVKTGTNTYSGECGVCSGSSVVWGPVSITVSGDGNWLTQYCQGSTSTWARVP